MSASKFHKAQWRIRSRAWEHLELKMMTGALPMGRYSDRPSWQGVSSARGRGEWGVDTNIFLEIPHGAQRCPGYSRKVRSALVLVRVRNRQGGWPSGIPLHHSCPCVGLRSRHPVFPTQQKSAQAVAGQFTCTWGERKRAHTERGPDAGRAINWDVGVLRKRAQTGLGPGADRVVPPLMGEAATPASVPSFLSNSIVRDASGARPRPFLPLMGGRCMDRRFDACFTSFHCTLLYIRPLTVAHGAVAWDRCLYVIDPTDLLGNKKAPNGPSPPQKTVDPSKNDCFHSTSLRARRGCGGSGGGGSFAHVQTQAAEGGGAGCVWSVHPFSSRGARSQRDVRLSHRDANRRARAPGAQTIRMGSGSCLAFKQHHQGWGTGTGTGSGIGTGARAGTSQPAQTNAQLSQRPEPAQPKLGRLNFALRYSTTPTNTTPPISFPRTHADHATSHSTYLRAWDQYCEELRATYGKWTITSTDHVLVTAAAPARIQRNGSLPNIPNLLAPQRA
eukprot:gene24952-biopygen5978